MTAPRRTGRFRALLALAWLTLAWERLWSGLWMPAALVAGFGAVVTLDLLPQLPGWLHALVLAGFVVLLAALVRRAARGFRPAGVADARHRVERDSRLDHRPLTALDDRLAAGTGNPVAEALWQAHRRRMEELSARLRIGAPSPGLARLDPRGLRAAALLILVIGLAAGFGDYNNRLVRALVPNFGERVVAAVGLDVWITPPAYTGQAPIFLRAGAAPTETVVQIPAGSALLAQASGTAAAPTLRVGTTETAFEPIAARRGAKAPAAYRIETTIEAGDRLTVTAGDNVIGDWSLDVVADAPPMVEFTGPPARTQRAHLRVDYEAKDDYGLAGVAAVIHAPTARSRDGKAPEIRFALPLTGSARGGGIAEAKGSVTRDLTAHPWAGVPVQVWLEAEDGRGQKAKSGIVDMILPERIFNHPAARAIVAERKKLVDPTPEVLDQVQRGLDEVRLRPRLYFEDTVVFLALTVARARLGNHPGDKDVEAVQKLLWDTALRIEDGTLSIAERELQRAQERLLEALKDANNPLPEEMERLLNELQRAIDRFLQAMMEEMQRQGLTEMPFDPDAEIFTTDDMQRLIDEARELARSGAMDAARQKLAELQRMLDNLRSGMMQQGQPNEQMRQAQRLMDGLRALTQRQQQLLDQTFRRSQDPNRQGRQGQRRQGPPGDQGEADEDADLAAQQEALRQALGELMLQMDEMLGKIPEALGKAERAMRDAAGSLAEGRPDQAVPSQTEALEQLRGGMDQAGQQMARQFGRMPGMMMGRQGRMPGGDRRDPFGRPTGGQGGAASDDSTTVPDKMEMMRAREILEELRRRAGDRRRPRLELDYIDRLLRFF